MDKITDEHGKQWYRCAGKDCAGRHKQVVCSCDNGTGCRCHCCETFACGQCCLRRDRAEVAKRNEVTKDGVAKAAGMPFLDYAILKLEQYGFHFTSHMEWDEMKRLARLGAAVETGVWVVTCGVDREWESISSIHLSEDAAIKAAAECAVRQDCETKENDHSYKGRSGEFVYCGDHDVEA